MSSGLTRTASAPDALDRAVEGSEEAYISAPYGRSMSSSGLMGPHPRSDARNSLDPNIWNVTLKTVYKKRKELPNGLPFSGSAVHVPIEKDIAVEYTSTVNLLTDRRKHVRHAYYPQSKFTSAPTTLSEIGWLQHDDAAPYGQTTGWLRAPKHGVGRSPMVKYFENLITTGAVNVMRGAVGGAKSN